MSAAPSNLDPEPTHWFALHVKQRHERAVANGLREKDIPSLVPILAERRRWSDRLKTVRTPIFPGYVFCELRGKARLEALRTPGVLRLVGFGGHPCPLAPMEVESLTALSATSVAARQCGYLPAGQRVRLVDGPLAGLSGVLENSTGESRLIVSIELLQRSIAVDVGGACVQAIAPLPAGAQSR